MGGPSQSKLNGMVSIADLRIGLTVLAFVGDQAFSFGAGEPLAKSFDGSLPVRESIELLGRDHDTRMNPPRPAR